MDAKARTSGRGGGAGAGGGDLVLVALVPEPGEPAAEDPVDPFRADDLLLGPGEAGGVEDEGEALRAAETAARAVQLLEGADLSELRPVGAVDHQVGAVRKAVAAAEMVGGVGPERLERVIALDPALVEAALPPRRPRPPHRNRPEARRADQDEADAGVLFEGRQELRVERLDPLKGHPARLAREADQAEAAGGHHRELGDPVAVGLLDVAAGVG